MTDVPPVPPACPSQGHSIEGTPQSGMCPALGGVKENPPQGHGTAGGHQPESWTPVDTAREHLDPAGHDSALETFRHAASSILDAYQRTTMEGAVSRPEIGHNHRFCSCRKEPRVRAL